MNDQRSQLENQILVMDAQDGDVAAMQTLVARWQKRLWLHAYRLTDDEDAAWDVMQDTWHDVIKGLQKLHDPARFSAWVYRITTHKASNWIKKQRRHRHASIDSINPVSRPERSPIDLNELMHQLSTAQKALLSLYYFEQLSTAEISQVLHVPQGTVKSRLHTAREALKKLWIEQEKR